MTDSARGQVVEKIQAADNFRHRRPDKFSMQVHAPVCPCISNCVLLSVASLSVALLQLRLRSQQPARLCDFALNGRQGPHPPFHSPHQFRISQLL